MLRAKRNEVVDRWMIVALNIRSQKLATFVVSTRVMTMKKQEDTPCERPTASNPTSSSGIEASWSATNSS